MLVPNSKALDELLKSNESFKRNFEKLLLAFERRLWTKDTCFLFKSMCEDLFKSYKIQVSVNVKTNIDGDGRFSIDFLDEIPPEMVIAYNKLKKEQEEWDAQPFWKRWFSKRPT
jgi:hypothetical protein